MGEYFVGERLGEGGFSFVHMGTHKDTKEKVALKMLRKDKLSVSSASVRAQVEREIMSMSKIKHKHVIQLKHVDWEAKFTRPNGTQLDVILVVLELATGGELFELLAFTGCFEEAIARTYFQQLISGVGYCHGQGVAHRDLKPENLLMDAGFQLKMIDFGFAKVIDAAQNAQQLMFTQCGTPGYMAPEMLGGKGYDATVSDIWACGVILFIMLAGFPPFQKAIMNDWWFSKLATNKHALFWQAHSRSAYFSDSTKDFINKILQPDPAKRMTVADIKKHPWFNGPVISDAQLVAELTRRKNEVDEQKARQRLEQKQQAAASAASGGGSLDDEVDRAVSADMLPDSSPQFSVSRVYNSSSSFDFGGASFMMGEEDKKSDENEKPPVFQPEDHLTCYTRFETAARPAVVLSRVNMALESMMGKTRQDKFMLKSQVTTMTGVVKLTVKVFADPKVDGRNVVLFRRQQGDSMQFRSLYSALREQVSDLIAAKAAPASATPVPVAPTAISSPSSKVADAAPVAASAVVAPVVTPTPAK